MTFRQKDLAFVRTTFEIYNRSYIFKNFKILRTLKNRSSKKKLHFNRTFNQKEVPPKLYMVPRRDLINEIFKKRKVRVHI